MNIRTRHMAILTYAGIAALAIGVKPDLIASMTDLMMLVTPLAGMFVWDKIKGTK